MPYSTIEQSSPPPDTKETRIKITDNERKVYAEQLIEALTIVSTEINAGAKDEGAKGELVNKGCRINTRSFSTEKDGPYESSDIEDDEQHCVQQEELAWGIDTNNPKVLSHFKNTHGITSPEGIKKKFQKDKQKSNGNLLEMAITIIFYKVLKEKYLAVRSAKYDDYENGIDNVIVDKETGDVICTFDEVSDEETGKHSSEKFKRIIKNAKKGGTRIKYGITYQKNEYGSKLVKTSLKNIPTFILAVTQSELKKILDGMNYDINEPPSEAELEIFDKLIKSLEGQTNQLLNQEINIDVRANLEKFVGSLETMKDISNNHKTTNGQ